MKLIIDRKTWLRGEGSLHSYLRRPADDKMCCLGFCAVEVEKIDPVALLGQRFGHEYIPRLLLQSIDGSTHANDDDRRYARKIVERVHELSPDNKKFDVIACKQSAVATLMMRVNDTDRLSEVERETFLVFLFKHFGGIDVEFTS